MRPTLLNFRPPEERTAEFRKINFTHDGNNLQYIKVNKEQKVPI